MSQPNEYEIKAKFREEYSDEYLFTLDPDVVEKLWVAYAKGFCDGARDALRRL